MLQIIMVIVGVSVLFKGETTLTKTRRVRGTVARFIGVLFLAGAALPFFVQLDNPGNADGALHEIGVMVGLFFVAVIIGFAGSEKIDPDAEAEEGDEAEEERPRRKKRRKKKRKKRKSEDA